MTDGSLKSDSPPTGKKTAGAARVLVVDDDHALCRALGRMLAKDGYEVVAVTDGLEAAELLRRESFDLILSDITMPDMDGIQLLRAARVTDLDVPVVLMTGLPDVRTAMQALEYGAFQYLPKPVEPARLAEVVARGIKLHRMARMKRETLAMLGRQAGEAGDRVGLELSFGRVLSTLWMAFQPIVRASDRQIFGYEALLRSGEPSLPHPGAVLEAAERLDRLPELGRRVRASSAEAIAREPDRGLLFVNLHTRDLCDEALFAHDAPLSAMAARVVLEITERESLEQVHDARERLVRLREMGFRVAIDDLGAGYAGLTSFALVEPEIVKLDMALVRDVHKTVTKQKLVRSMTTLCKDMGMLVVAEGVESADERDALVELECDLLQGYLFARPARPFPAHVWGPPGHTLEDTLDL